MPEFNESTKLHLSSFRNPRETRGLSLVPYAKFGVFADDDRHKEHLNHVVMLILVLELLLSCLYYCD